MIPETDEGINTWMTPDEIQNTPNDNGLVDYLPMFFNEYGEAYAPHTDEKPLIVVFK